MTYAYAYAYSGTKSFSSKFIHFLDERYFDVINTASTLESEVR